MILKANSSKTLGLYIRRIGCWLIFKEITATMKKGLKGLIKKSIFYQ